MAERIPLWKKLNLSSLMIGVGCVIAGMGAASLYGNLKILSGTLCMVFAAFSQLSANMANRYYDERHALGAGIDQKISAKRQPTATSMLKECAVAMFLLAIMVGLAILTMCGWWVLPIGIFIVVAGWLCSNGETPLMRTPLSPLVAFFLFGPVCVISSYLVQTIPDALHPIGWYDVQPAVYIGIAFGFLAANANIVYNYVRYYPDLRNCRSSMVTELGRKKLEDHIPRLDIGIVCHSLGHVPVARHAFRMARLLPCHRATVHKPLRMAQDAQSASSAVV